MARGAGSRRRHRPARRASAPPRPRRGGRRAGRPAGPAVRAQGRPPPVSPARKRSAPGAPTSPPGRATVYYESERTTPFLQGGHHVELLMRMHRSVPAIVLLLGVATRAQAQPQGFSGPPASGEARAVTTAI